MAMKVWNVGDVLTASDMNIWVVPRAVVKPSDQSLTSTTTMVNDTALVLPVDANATYDIHGFLLYEGGVQNSSDMKIQWTFPAGLTMYYQLVGIDTGGVIRSATHTQATVPTIGSNGAGTRIVQSVNGTVIVSSTAGNLQLQWAQNTSSGTATIMHAMSHLQLHRIA